MRPELIWHHFMLHIILLYITCETHQVVNAAPSVAEAWTKSETWTYWLCYAILHVAWVGRYGTMAYHPIKEYAAAKCHIRSLIARGRYPQTPLTTSALFGIL